jgi:hypothetical protein
LILQQDEAVLKLNTGSVPSNPIEFCFGPKSFRIGIPYKINIYSAVFGIGNSNVSIESKELHQKIQAMSEHELTVFTVNENVTISL